MGMWMVSNLVSAISPDELDALDEPLPFSRCSLDALLGRTHSPAEYEHYFKHFPGSERFSEFYERLSTEAMPAQDIIPLSLREHANKSKCLIM
jgi:hypothetical protein